jgi:RNA polymerase sigma factor (sigma-70 family)
MLEKLVQRNKDWLSIAKNICGDYHKAQDIVQDMYIKLQNSKFESDWFVIHTMRNLYIDQIRKNKEDLFLEDISLKDYNNTFEPNDKEQEYLDRFNDLPMVQQELIQESFDKSTRQIGREFNINYCYVHRQIHKGLKKILKEDYKKYKNSNLKYLKKRKNESN